VQKKKRPRSSLFSLCKGSYSWPGTYNQSETLNQETFKGGRRGGGAEVATQKNTFTKTFPRQRKKTRLQRLGVEAKFWWHYLSRIQYNTIREKRRVGGQLTHIKTVLRKLGAELLARAQWEPHITQEGVNHKL